MLKPGKPNYDGHDWGRDPYWDKTVGTGDIVEALQFASIQGPSKPTGWPG